MHVNVHAGNQYFNLWSMILFTFCEVWVETKLGQAISSWGAIDAGKSSRIPIFRRSVQIHFKLCCVRMFTRWTIAHFPFWAKPQLSNLPCCVYRSFSEVRLSRWTKLDDGTRHMSEPHVPFMAAAIFFEGFKFKVRSSRPQLSFGLRRWRGLLGNCFCPWSWPCCKRCVPTTQS